MSAMPVLWIVWAGVAVILLILLGYRGTLTRYEEDQIFLDDAGNHQQQQQNAILLKVARITPYVRVAITATCVLSACILGFYVWDAIRNLS
jgi:membrane protein YdbS with pleckstrin-like domain